MRDAQAHIAGIGTDAGMSSAIPDIIRFDGVSYRYPGGKDVLTDVSFSIRQGEMLYVTGPSGAGKTTLLRLIAALCHASRGQIVVMGQNLSALKNRRIPAYRQHIGLVFQNFNLLYDRTVFDNVALPLVVRGYTHADIGRRTRAALDAVGLLKREKSLPLTLSGGEQQRVGIARAIVTKPALILADEPTGNLDTRSTHEVLDIFDQLNGLGRTIVLITHEDEVAERARRVVRMRDGKIVSDARNAPRAAAHLSGGAR